MGTPERAWRVLLLHQGRERAEIIERALIAEGHTVLRHAQPLLGLQAETASPSAEVIIVDSASTEPSLLEEIARLSERAPRPVVLFTQDADRAAIRDSVRAGVTSYVVDGLAPERVCPIVEVAVARFEAHQSARHDRDRAVAKLAERKLVERAKGILMSKRGIAENEAYEFLRKLAMRKGMRMSKLAEQVIEMSELID